MKRLLRNTPYPAVALAAESEAVLHPAQGCHNISLAFFQEQETEPELRVGQAGKRTHERKTFSCGCGLLQSGTPHPQPCLPGYRSHPTKL